MNDSTIIKPRPGSRTPIKPAADTSSVFSPDNTQFFTTNDTSSSRLHLPSTNFGELTDNAGNIFSLICRLTEINQEPKSLDTLRDKAINLIHQYNRSLSSSPIPDNVKRMASYCLCALVDETVLNTTWGRESHWSQQSLLSEFHNETLAGSHFFEILNRTIDNKDNKLLMLQYLCLCLGFKGQYRLSNNGYQELEMIRDKVFHCLSQPGSNNESPIDSTWKDRLVTGKKITHQIPTWGFLSLCGIILVFTYLILVSQLRNNTQPLFDQLSMVGTDIAHQKEIKTETLQSTLTYLKTFLKTEIENNILTVEPVQNTIRIRISDDSLFASGSADIRPETKPVLIKIGTALEDTKGKVLITGHTDDQRIISTRYPSNWHLSLDRATTVTTFISNSAKLTGRLWPEGRGSSDPINTEDSDMARSMNRRVDIDLLVTE